MPGENEQPQGGRKAEDIEAELRELEQTEAQLKGKWQAPTEGEPDAEDADALAAEELAMQKGWVPKDKYKGDPAKWVDAKTFNERGERFVKNLEMEVKSLRAKVQSFEGTKKQLQKVFSDQIKAKDTELQSVMQTLRQQKLEATREGDDDLVIQLEDRIEGVRDQRTKLKEEMTAAEQEAAASEQEEVEGTPARGPNAADPMLQEWIADGNDWFETDPKLRNYALALGEELIKTGFKQKGRPFLDKVTEEMRVQFPATFRKMDAARKGESERNNPADAGGANSGGKRASGKTERDLPPEDFAIMKELIADGVVTKEAFLKSYFSKNG